MVEMMFLVLNLPMELQIYMTKYMSIFIFTYTYPYTYDSAQVLSTQFVPMDTRRSLIKLEGIKILYNLAIQIVHRCR